jgi:hypothetical protein
VIGAGLGLLKEYQALYSLGRLKINLMIVLVVEASCPGTPAIETLV